MNNTNIRLLAALVVLIVVCAVGWSLSVPQMRRAGYSFCILPPPQWSVGFYRSEIIVDPIVPYRAYSVPTGWVQDLGFVQIKRQYQVSPADWEQARLKSFQAQSRTSQPRLRVRYASARGPRIARDQLDRYGPFKLGVTIERTMQREFGPGVRTIGGHPNSQLTWSLRGGGTLSVDAWWYKSSPPGPGGYIVDQVQWETGPSVGVRRVWLTYHGLQLGVPRRRVIAAFEVGYHRRSGFPKELEWQFAAEPHHLPLIIDAGFTRGRLTDLTVYADDQSLPGPSHNP